MSAAFGVGGAVVSTPGIRALGASAFVAVGTTLPSILPSAASGTMRYVKEGLIDWRVVRWAAPAGVVAAVLGSLASHAVPGHGHWLMVLTAALLATTAWRMARTPPPTALATNGGPVVVTASPVQLAGVGVVAGALSGLLGIGGGVVMVPGFTEVVGMSVKSAIATS